MEIESGHLELSRVSSAKTPHERELSFQTNCTKVNLIIRRLHAARLTRQRRASEAGNLEAGSASNLNTVGLPEEDPNQTGGSPRRHEAADECPCPSMPAQGCSPPTSRT